MGFPDGSIKHFSMTHDIRNLLMFVDVVFYGSLREEPSFPPLLLRAMSSEIPIIAPNLTCITKYVCYFIQSTIFYLLFQVLKHCFNNMLFVSGH
jgi:hypothetical protein